VRDEASKSHDLRTVGVPFRLPKASELVAAQLRHQIIRGELADGQYLPAEAVLIAQFGVSRPTLREAIRILEAESLITVRRGARGGAQVHLPDPHVAATYTGLMLQSQGVTLEDVYDARLAIEVAAVRRAAISHSSRDIATLREAAERDLPIVESPGSTIIEQTAFHKIIMDISGNKTLSAFSSMIHRIVELANYSSATSNDAADVNQRGLVRAAKAHVRLVDLIEAGKVQEAIALWTAHLSEAKDYALGGGSTDTVLDLLDQVSLGQRPSPRRGFGL